MRIGLLFYFSYLENFMLRQIFYITFPISKIFSNTKFCVCLFQFTEFFPVPNFSHKFFNLEILSSTKVFLLLFRLRKFSLALLCFILLFRFKKFSPPPKFYIALTTPKIFFNIKFFVTFSFSKIFSVCVCSDGKIFHTNISI